MNQQTLTGLRNQLLNIRGALNLPNQQLDMLYQDINDHYLGGFDELPDGYRNAWDEAVARRLLAITVAPAVRTAFEQFKLAWRSAGHTAQLRILFGQMRVGPDFQGAMNEGQNTVVGMPDVVGRPIVVVSGLIQQGAISPDQFPVHIFYSQRHQRWVTINNRGYSAFCHAGVRPLRLLPTPPSQAELNRLNDVEGQGMIGNMQYAQGFTGPNLDVRPRTLPSDQMPVTDGPNSWIIQRVIEVPPEWA
jgi:hypothetical protein